MLKGLHGIQSKNQPLFYKYFPWNFECTDLDKGAMQLSGWWKTGIMDRPSSLKIKKAAVKCLVKCTDMSTTGAAAL